MRMHTMSTPHRFAFFCAPALARAWAGAALALLSACGGGGGTGATPASTLPLAVGAWEDTSSPRRVLASLILDSGAYWLFYRQAADGSAGFEQGTATATGQTLQADMVDYPNGFSAYAVSVNATLASRSIAGTRTWRTGQDAFALTPLPASAFDAQHAPQISDIQGDWTHGTLSSPSASSAAVLSLQSDGRFYGSNGGCQYSGTLSPQSGVNAYAVVLNFAAGTCSHSTLSASGLALAYHPTSGGTQLFLAVQDSSRQYGWLFTATR